MHRRLSPKVHQFNYHLFYLALDLDELDEVTKKVRGLSRNHWNLYEFRDRDHLTLPGLEAATVKENIVAWVRGQGKELPSDVKILLVTLPRVFGYIFNPVSFYFISDSAGQTLCTVVQVGNTFREMKPYLIAQPTTPGFFRLITPKHFYVSPFSGLELCFDFKINVPGEQLEIHIDDRLGTAEDSERTLLSSLTGKRIPLTTARLAWCTIKFPFVTLKVIFFIHWHALRLWLKKIPFHRKAAQPELQKEVYNPYV